MSLLFGGCVIVDRPDDPPSNVEAALLGAGNCVSPTLKPMGPSNMIPTRDTSKKPTSPHQGNQPPNNRCRSFASTHRHQKPSYRQRLKGHSTKKKTRQSDTTSEYLFVCACLSDWPHPVCRER